MTKKISLNVNYNNDENTTNPRSYYIEGHEHDTTCSYTTCNDGSINEYNSNGKLIRHYDIQDCWFW